MGRTAGHLALGVGSVAGASLTIIPEEFGRRRPLSMSLLCDIIEGAAAKDIAVGHDYGVVVLAQLPQPGRFWLLFQVLFGRKWLALLRGVCKKAM